MFGWVCDSFERVVQLHIVFPQGTEMHWKNLEGIIGQLKMLSI